MDAMAATHPLRPAHSRRATPGSGAAGAHEDTRRTGRRTMGLEAVSVGCARQTAAGANAAVERPRQWRHPDERRSGNKR
jgi:hypothetical protein